MSSFERTRKEEILHDSLVGLIRGTQAVHSLPSYLVTIPDRREWDESVGRTRLEKIVKVLTIAGETATYGFLGIKGIPAYIAPAITNGLDILGYFIDKVAQWDLASSAFRPFNWPLDEPKWDKVYWGMGAGWESWLPGFYDDLPL